MKYDKTLSNRSYRDTRVEILRIVLITMIVIHHCLVHGLKMSDLKLENCSAIPPLFQFLLNSFVIVGVNGFFWISGYFGVKRNIKKIIRLYLLCIYSEVVWNIAAIVLKFEVVSFNKIINIVFPIRDYWFIAVYIALVLLSPYINNIMNNSTKKEQLISVGIVTSINILYGFVFNFVGIGDGYTVFQGINMYIIGRLCYNNILFIKKYFKRIMLVVLFILSAILLGGLTYCLSVNGYSTKAWHMFAYNDPIVILMSVIFCLIFVIRDRVDKSRIVTKMISIASGSCLAAYLLTDNLIAKKYVFGPLKTILSTSNGNPIEISIIIVCYSILLVVICVIVDIIRKIILQLLSNLKNKYL
ncbi:MAG: acyltransferase family protein [Lachnospiraceae bacterium]